jgi:IPT/TIG domain/Fibronectin type III domain
VNQTLSNNVCWRSVPRRLLLLVIVLTIACLLPSASRAATITYVQGNYAVPHTTTTSVPIVYTAAQAAGDLNVVVVSSRDTTSTVSSVTDTSNNTYALAVGPTVASGYGQASTYYAKNIKAAGAGANTVTVTYASEATNPDIRIVEYSGADPNNPVDVTAASTGTGSTSSSGSVTTTNATDLLFGANRVQTLTTGPGSGFTQRLLTSPNGDIAEDRMVTATGSYSATAPMSSAGIWIMQMVAFRTPVSGGATPTVTSVSPNTGTTAGGTAVTITGTNFVSGATVTFGTAAAPSVVVTNSTTITALTPAGSAGAVTVTVTVSGQSGSLASGFTYVATPTVTSVSPNTGSTGGGTAVTITGTNFVSGATVTFGTGAATSVVVASSSSITAITPAGTAGAVTVTVTVSGQSGSLASGFTYAAIPSVTSVSPNTGTTAGSTAVTITGTNFANGATVTFGTAAATSVVVVSGTSITALTPAGSPGAVTVTVTVSGQSGSLANGFTYVATPTITGVSPNTGSTAGGTAVTITGTNFVTGATVTFGTAAATSVVLVNSTTITALTPAGSAGAVSVTVTVSGQSGSLASGFTYAVIPTVTSLSPNTGSTAGGTAVTITGTNFVSGATVTFGTAAATGVVVTNSTTITALTPAGTAGAATVTVTDPGPQSGSLANGFTYVATPTITGVSPNTGSTAGGTAVTITGTNFVSGATVTFGTAVATSVVMTNSTTITALTPAGSAGAVSVTVTVSGQSGSLASGFTYAVIPTVTGVSPNTGTTAGGTAVTITGTNFATGATVTFGTAAATGVVVTNSTTITALTPAGSAGAATVTVTVSGQSGSLASGFTYVAATTTITYVQGNYAVPHPSASTVPVTFTAAQTAGDLNVAVVGWNDSTATVSSVTDSSGNIYALAVGPTVVSGVLSQSIYYARNIATAAAGANIVTVTFSATAASPDIRILEYKGADLNNPVDVTAGASGTSTTSSSGSATTTNATDLLFGANIVATVTTGPGSGFTKRLLTSPDGDIAEDEMLTATGSHSATAPVSPSGAWIMQMVAFRTTASGGDTTPPTAPSNLTATAASASQINLSWTASTDNVGVTGYLVERCQGAGCGSFAQVGTSTTTTYNDIGLTGSTSYSYRVRATDASRNLSQYSNTATATTAASPKPTAPTNLSAVDGGAAPVIVAVQSYDNPNLLTSHTTAAFNSTGGDAIVICSSSHSGVTFTPTDSYGNTYIPIAGPTNTTTGFDLRTALWYVQNPIVGPNHTVTMGLSIPESLVISIFVVKGSDISSPLDAVSLVGSDNGTQSVNTASPSIATALNNDLLVAFLKVSAGATFTAGNSFTLQTTAVYNFLAGESGPAATPSSYDATFTINTPQTWQSAVVAVANNPNQTTLSWTASTETGGIIGSYLVWRCASVGCTNFAQVGTTTTTSFNDTGVTPATSYSYEVQAEDTSNSIGPFSSVVTIVTPATIPSLPGDLTTTTVSTSQINLAWSAAVETGGTIADYQVQRCLGAGCTNFTQVGTSTTTTYPDSGLAEGIYNYRVSATDTAGSTGPFSNIATGMTLDTQPPTAPTNLTAAVVGTQINLSWAASTDNFGVTGYLVQRCQSSGCTNFAQVGTSTTTTYSDPGLAASTNYSYRVSATDAAGNVSQYSNTASATTAGTVAPSITYVQGNYAVPQTVQTSVPVTFTTAQAAGDLNVVVVGWNDTNAIVNTVTDKSGNTYTLAVGPTVVSGALSQSIYYAKNIAAAAAGANIVTVAFSTAAAAPDVRVLEYKGADPNNPVDVTAANSGSSTTSSSGSATTTNATDLLFGANIVQTTTTGPGSGFTSRLLTSPDGDIAEDETVAAIGSYTATAPVSPSGAWIMQMVAFRTPAQ